MVHTMHLKKYVEKCQRKPWERPRDREAQNTNYELTRMNQPTIQTRYKLAL